MNVDRSFWRPGSIVTLNEPFEPLEPESNLCTALRGEKWGGFTHGVIAQVVARDNTRQRNVWSVSLFLYNPIKQIIYIDEESGVPVYLDYSVDELTPLKDADTVGYATIEKRKGTQ